MFRHLNDTLCSVHNLKYKLLFERKTFLSQFRWRSSSLEWKLKISWLGETNNGSQIAFNPHAAHSFPPALWSELVWASFACLPRINEDVRDGLKKTEKVYLNWNPWVFGSCTFTQSLPTCGHMLNHHWWCSITWKDDNSWTGATEFVNSWKL